jgi:hypothetical protein
MSTNGNNDIIVNKNTLLTPTEIYNNIYITQLLEISKAALGFLVATYLAKILDLFFNTYSYNKFLYGFLMFIFLLCIIIISLNVFTYTQISKDKDQFIKNLVKT